MTLCYSFLWSCANPVALEGGPLDKRAPQLDTLRSTPNRVTRFNKREFVLVFDEWIQLDKILQQLVVSPPLEFPPEVKVKGKKVVFKFNKDEVLKQDATYTINFGDAIIDLTERNAASNTRFVFSTGDFIDSLTVQATAIDAFTGEPVKDALIMLYDNLSDTAVQKEKPFYFAKTDELGKVKIENVKNDTFRVYTLLDQNASITYDQASEGFGFLEEYIVISDSTQPRLNLIISEGDPPLRIASKDAPHYGLYQVLFTQPVPNLQVEANPEPALFQPIIRADSLYVWYDQIDSLRSWNLILTQDTLIQDTLRIKAGKRAEFLKEKRLEIKGAKKGIPLRSHPKEDIRFTFQHPIAKINQDLIQLYVDTTLTPTQANILIDPDRPEMIRFQAKWKPEGLYTIDLAEGAITDIFGITHDSIRQEVVVQGPKAFGNIEILLEDLLAEQSYLMQLRQEDQTIRQAQIIGDTIFQIRYELLPPGNYDLQIVEDRNANARWDGVNYEARQQPERVFLRPLEALRANWDVEVTEQVNRSFGQKKIPKKSKK